MGKYAVTFDHQNIGIGTLLRLKPKSRNLLSFLAHKSEFYLVIVDFSQKYARLYALCGTLFMFTWLAFYSAQYFLCHFGHELERPVSQEIRPPSQKGGDIPRIFAPPGANLLGISPPRGANLLGISPPFRNFAPPYKF